MIDIDMETSSAAPLQTVGAAAYLAHPSTICLMAAYHPVGDPTAVRLWCRGEPVPDELIDLTRSPIVPDGESDEYGA